MEFASKHAYIGQDEEAEVDDSLLQSVEAAGGLMNAVSMAQQQQQQEPVSEEEGESLGLDDGDMVAADEAKPSEKHDAAKSSKGGFFSRLFSGSSNISSSNSNRADSSDYRRARKAESAAPRDQAARSGFANFLSRNAASPPPPPAPAAASAAASMAPPPQAQKRAFRRAVDTNVLAIKFSTLANSGDDVFAGDPTMCEECGAALSHLSTVLDHEGKVLRAGAGAQPQVAPGGLAVVAEQAPAASAAAVAGGIRGLLPADVHLEAGQWLWACDFCSHANVLDGMQLEEIPTGPQRDHVLGQAPGYAAAAPAAAAAGGANAADDESYLVFCLDVSGSMCVSSPVPGRIALRGAKALDPALLALGDVDLSGVGARARETYVSRLQAVQASIDKQLCELEKKSPKRKVMLVVFNGELNIIGDGSAGSAIVVAGDKLTQQAELERIGREDIPAGRPISQSRVSLTDALFALEETGPTALGPALVVSMALASRVRGSQVVVCTDGVANVGLGAIDTKGGREGEAAVQEWYQARGTQAQEAGTTVSILSIKGDECRLELLGLVAAATQGQVQRVDPADLLKAGSFGGGMLNNPTIATNVSVTFLLHCGMLIRGEDEELRKQNEAAAEGKKKKLAAKPAAPPAEAAPAAAAAAAPVAEDAAAAAAPFSLSKLTREIGNVQRDSETALEYGLRSKAELARFAHLASLPFQAQIRYTTLAGLRVLRIHTQAQPVTTDRVVAEKDVKLELLSAQVASKSAQLAREGKYKQARQNWISAAPMLSRAAQSPQQQQVFSNYAANIDQFDRAVAQQARAEKEAGGASDDEDDARGDSESDGGALAAPSGSSAAAAPRAYSGLRKKAAAPASRKAKQADEVYRVIHATHQLNSAGLL